MKPSEIIRAQRDALMSGEYRWVKHSPNEGDDPNGQACAVMRRNMQGDAISIWEEMSKDGINSTLLEINVVRRAIRELGYAGKMSEVEHDSSATVAWWNDNVAENVSQVIDVLERSEKYAIMEEESGRGLGI